MIANIVEKFNQLPPNPQGKALRRKKKLKLDWVGGLKEYRDQYTALELQKEAIDWWERSALGYLDQKREEPIEEVK